MLTGCAKGGQTDAALQLLREIKESEIPLNECTYGAAIDACARAGRSHEALELLRELRKEHKTSWILTHSRREGFLLKVQQELSMFSAQGKKYFCLLSNLGKGFFPVMLPTEVRE